jgi:hypothetical protein
MKSSAQNPSRSRKRLDVRSRRIAVPDVGTENLELYLKTGCKKSISPNGVAQPQLASVL